MWGAVPLARENLSRAALNVKREHLTSAELATGMDVQFALPLRNLAELNARVARGEIVSQSELEEKYFPHAADYAAVTDWLRTQGVRVDHEDPTHLTVFGHAPVETVGAALRTRFSVVEGVDGHEYVSAVTEPQLPAEIARQVLAINRLQPHIRPRPQITLTSPTSNNMYTLGPRTVAELYRADQTTLTGAGESIIVLGIQVDFSDLTQFWNSCGIPRTIDSVTTVTLVAGTPPPDPTRNAENDGNVAETTMDLQWAGAMAPAAKLVFIPTIDWAGVSSAISQRVKAGDRTMHQLTCSWGLEESSMSLGAIQSYSQYFTAIAANGITIFVASGDNGSNPRNFRGESPPSAYWPACDLNVTGVGGTSTDLASYNVLSTFSEGSWNWSGGGLSLLSRPWWQTGPGMPAGTQRCVPDVAAPASGQSLPAFVVYNGKPTVAGGTSLSSPIWAGLCALLNEARSRLGQPPLGLLGPKIYPLAGTGAFTDIADGRSNGLYRASAGYDLVTGLGSPDIDKLSRALTVGLSAPTAHLANISARTFVGTDNGVQIAGFVIEGPDDKTVLIRANGPALQLYGVEGYLRTPKLQVYSAGTVVASNTGWLTPSTINGVAVNQATEVNRAVGRVGASVWSANSADSALVLTLRPGAYTAMVSGANNTSGTALVELYDADSTQNSHLTNISTRSLVKTGSDVQIAGFVIAGEGPRTILIRANGPALKNYGITDYVPNPVLEVYSQSHLISTNTGWAGSVQISQVGSVVGAAPWAADSHDSALMLTLPPGAYSAVIRDASDVVGNALVEVYEVP